MRRNTLQATSSCRQVTERACGLRDGSGNNKQDHQRNRHARVMLQRLRQLQQAQPPEHALQHAVHRIVCVVRLLMVPVL